MLVTITVLVEGKPELLDGRDDDLVRVVIGLKAADKRRGVCVFLDTVFLETVELLSGLAIEILAVDNEDALVDALVGLEERRSKPSLAPTAFSTRPNLTVTSSTSGISKTASTRLSTTSPIGSSRSARSAR